MLQVSLDHGELVPGHGESFSTHTTLNGQTWWTDRFLGAVGRA